MDWIDRLQQPKYWLLGISAALVALHLTLAHRSDNSELFTTSLLFWIVAGSLVWDQRQQLQFNSSMLPSAIGTALLALLLVRSASLPTATTFLEVFPLLAILSTALLASGFRGLRQYWKELVIFGLFAIHTLLTMLLQSANMSELTAIVSTFLLKFMGFSVARDGTFLNLPTGRVEVYDFCSGVQSTLQMLNISVLFLMMFSLRSRLQRVLCIGVGMALGFMVNAVRVALMAILVAFSNKTAFQYWHGGDGSLIFSAISVLLFGGFCWLVFLREPPQPPSSGV